MRLLLDTQVMLWWLLGDPRLHETTRRLMASTPCVVLVASIWEVSNKHRLGKLPVHLSPELAERARVNRGQGVQIAQHATLSGREVEVLRRLTRGESPPAIDTVLTVVARDVSFSYQRIMAKLGLSSLADMVC